MPIPVQTGRQIGPLRRAFGLFGGMRLKLDEVVVPVALIEDLVPDEFRDCFSADTRGNAGAGASHKWSLRNPAGSGVLAELYEWGMDCSTAALEWEVRVEDPPFVPGTVLGTQFQDLNGEFNTPQSFPACEYRHAQSAALLAGTVVLAVVAAASQPFTWRPKAVLHPGQDIVLHGTNQNNNGQTWIQWRERPLRSGE